MQKEREAEGDQYADKEKFVTTAYRKKMEEQAKEEEEEARLARMEAALDVTKQNDLSGFYRHIYRQVTTLIYFWAIVAVSVQTKGRIRIQVINSDQDPQFTVCNLA